jgi:ABC-type glutathione transport system ATPase component
VNGTFSWNIQERTLLTNKRLKSTGKERKEGNQRLAKLQLQKNTQERQSASMDRALTNLEGINFQVKRGEFVAIVGTVGSGKSSFLLALLGEMEV